MTKDETLGLDIGSFSVKIVRLRRVSGKYAVVAAGIAAISPGEEQDSRQRTRVIAAINACAELAAAKTKSAVCGVRGPEVAVREFEFPSLPADEIGGAVLLEASQVCPFNSEDSALDYQVISNSEGKTRGVLVAATNSLIKDRVGLAKEASLDSVLIDVDGLALLNCFSESQEAESGQTTAILNVGASYSTLAIMDQSGWPFIRDMTYAGNDIVSSIASEMGMPPDKVQEILSGEAGQEQSRVRSCLGKACERLIVDVTNTSRYYKAQADSGAFQRILVCGGFALVNGFVELLDSLLPVEVVLWNPFEGMACEAGPKQEKIIRENGPAMAVAAGLAMRSI